MFNPDSNSIIELADEPLEDTPTAKSVIEHPTANSTELEKHSNVEDRSSVSNSNLLSIPKPDFRHSQQKGLLYSTCNSEADFMTTCLSNMTGGMNSTKFMTGCSSFGLFQDHLPVDDDGEANDCENEAIEKEEKTENESKLGDIVPPVLSSTMLTSSNAPATSATEEVGDELGDRSFVPRKCSVEEYRPRKISSSQEPMPTSTAQLTHSAESRRSMSDFDQMLGKQQRPVSEGRSRQCPTPFRTPKNIKGNSALLVHWASGVWKDSHLCLNCTFSFIY